MSDMHRVHWLYGSIAYLHICNCRCQMLCADKVMSVPFNRMMIRAKDPYAYIGIKILYIFHMCIKILFRIPSHFLSLFLSSSLSFFLSIAFLLFVHFYMKFIAHTKANLLCSVIDFGS